jgi:hypothetical protein
MVRQIARHAPNADIIQPSQAVRRITASRSHPARRGNRAKYEAHDRVGESLAIQKAEPQESKHEAKEGNDPHSTRGERQNPSVLRP